MPEPTEWTAQDEPVVLKAGWGAHSCTSCRYWSAWLPSTGDCLYHAYHRREQIAGGETPTLPARSARMTSTAETCVGWTSLSEEEQRRADRRRQTEATT